MERLSLARRYAPIIHVDVCETIPLLAYGITVFEKTRRSESFPKREVNVPQRCKVIEYACFWDYDIQHMYDLEHIWVTVDEKGCVCHVEGSFHGKYLNLYDAGMPFALQPEDEHVHAFCQPGKHAFLPDGQQFRLIPGWYESCNMQSGGDVLVGGPFGGCYQPAAEDHARCRRYLREHLAFQPTLKFRRMEEPVQYMLWDEMARWIPRRVAQECERLKGLYP